MRFVAILVVLVACGKSKDKGEEPGSAAGPTANPASERDKLVADVQRKVGSDGIAKVSIEGPALILDARKGADECRALMDTIETKFRPRLRAQGIKAVRCMTTAANVAKDVDPNY